MLAFNLTPIFKVKGIDKPYTFLVKSGFTPHAAHNLLSSSTRVFRLDHVELLCKVLLCEPNDLLVWIPEKGVNYAADFPLIKLKQTDTAFNLKETFATMSYNQLKQVAKTIIEPGENKQ